MVTGIEVGEVGVRGGECSFFCLLCVYEEVDLLQVSSLMDVNGVEVFLLVFVFEFLFLG